MSEIGILTILENRKSKLQIKARYSVTLRHMNHYSPFQLYIIVIFAHRFGYLEINHY